MVSLSGLGKPQYLFRPSQIVRRLLRELRLNTKDGLVRLPWGMDITVDPADTVGHALLCQGIYDLLTTEMLWRLTERNDRTADIGANIGYMSSVLARRAGAGGSVLSFEPHPRTFVTLGTNVHRWNGHSAYAQISARQGAVSDREGRAHLATPWHADPNVSHAAIADAASATGIEVQTWPFRNFFDSGATFGVVKVDTEGHELQVFAGMADELRAGRIRDLVYEETAGYPAASHAFLEDAGYRIFTVEERLRGPLLVYPADPPQFRRAYEIAPSYIATRQAERLRDLFARTGWPSLAG